MEGPVGAAMYRRNHPGAFRRTGPLRLDDPLLAAQQVAGMILWVPVNRVMFCGEDAALPAADVERCAAAGAHAFLAAYGRHRSPRARTS
jgi:hypothetical protein